MLFQVGAGTTLAAEINHVWQVGAQIGFCFRSLLSSLADFQRLIRLLQDDVPCIGRAMSQLVPSLHNVLRGIFQPGFLEQNTPSCVRRQPMTSWIRPRRKPRKEALK